MTRRDLYGECNTEGAPVDQFTAECCMRCINPDCTRSSYGKSHFDLRVNSWYERLFSDVPTMDQGDPRFTTLASKRFLPIVPSIEVNSSWVDPRDLGSTDIQAAPVEPKQEVESPPVSNTETKEEPEVIEKPEKEEVSSPPAPVTTGKKMQRAEASNLAVTNTPAQKGQMISQGSQRVSTSSSSWDAPTPSADTEGVRVIKPGEKIKLG